jgi:hypothetical protein
LSVVIACQVKLRRLHKREHVLKIDLHDITTRTNRAYLILN